MTTTKEKRAPGRYDALDGLRAIAVFTVMAFHLYAHHDGSLSWNPIRPAGGFLSLDVFFVLSGFLITSLLLRELDRRGRISLRSFYARRALRLFPGLALLLIVTVGASLIWSGRFWSHPTLIGLPWVILYVGNWYVVTHNAALPLGAIGQTWSLGVEEQFYLLWPLMLIGLTRAWRNRLVLAAVVAGLAVADMVYRFVAIEALGWTSQHRIYFGSDTHADGLLMGCALGFLLSSERGVDLLQRAARPLRWAAGVSVVVLLWCALRLSEIRPVSVWLGIPIAVVTTTVIVINLIGPRPLPVLHHILTWRPVVWLGTRSYGLYLWQSTITMMLARIDFHLGYNKLAALEVLATIVIAGLSYRFVESPFLRRKERFSRAEALVPAAG